MKLTKPQIKQHEAALKLLDKDKLTYDEKLQVYSDWIPAYSEQIGKIASYFTPFEVARDFQLCFDGKNVVDLCAGIGMLSFLHYHFNSFQFQADITCVERNPTFVEVGKKLFPEANWVCADVLDRNVIKSLGHFDAAISNPPFGNIKSATDSSWLKYTGSEFDYKVIDVAAHIAGSGAFILPQMSAPFMYSGEREFRWEKAAKYKKFNKDTGIDLEPNCGIDLAYAHDMWVGTAITCEIVQCDFDPAYRRRLQSESEQISLFLA